jgi:hypothetical protein
LIKLVEFEVRNPEEFLDTVKELWTGLVKKYNRGEISVQTLVDMESLLEIGLNKALVDSWLAVCLWTDTIYDEATNEYLREADVKCQQK